MKKLLIFFIALGLAGLPASRFFVAAEDVASSVPVSEPAAEPETVPEAPLDFAAPAETPLATATETVSTPTTANLLDLEPEAPTGTLENVQTKFLEGGGPQGANQRAQIQALWAMNGTSGGLSGADDGQAAGAQFLPSGQFQKGKPFSVCAVVLIPSRPAEVGPVFSEVDYSETNPRTGQKACGQKKFKKQQMEPLTTDKGYNLFCEKIRSQNPNLPAFFASAGYGVICGQDGELQKETAAVYCADDELRYDDPSGDYAASVNEKNQSGQNNRAFSVTFQYMELTAFEIDFASLDYGKVELGARKVLEGDTAWQEPKAENRATVRNVGNTSLQMQVQQDDMGLGKTKSAWNIKYGSRVGSGLEWEEYWPGEAALLNGVLGLGVSKAMNFAVEVLGFPQDNTRAYSGQMTLDAREAESIFCGTSQNAGLQERGIDPGS